MNDWNLIGHDATVHRLQGQLAAGQLGQSLLIVGQASVGKATLAQALARAVLSQNAVDVNRAKVLADQRKHPDLTWIDAVDGSVKIDTVRAVLHTLTLTPMESQRRVVVFCDAHLATDESQNAILKTLEEPNARAMMILIAPSTDGVLPTIASRCQVMILRSVPRQTIVEALLQRGLEPDKADLISRLARGRPGWALSALENPELLEQRSRRIDELEQLITSNRTKRFAAAEALSKTSADALEKTLDDWLWFWRDVVRATTDTSDSERLRKQLHNIDRLEFIMRLSNGISHTAAVSMVRAITRSAQNLQRNARAQLVLDTLLLKMPTL